MTRLFPIVVLLLLGCAGLATPTARVTRRALSIELFQGTVTEDQDLGVAGDYDVERGATAQALSWEPDPDEETLDDQLDLLFDALRAVLPDASSEGPPTHVDAMVGGQRGRGFETTLAGSPVLVTAWRCPRAGVRAQLLTTAGFPSVAKSLHERSLASVDCGDVPVERDEVEAAWRFTGDPAEWTSATDEGDVIWSRSDDAIRVVTTSTAPWNDPGLPALCTGTLHLVHDGLAEDIRFDEAKSVYRDVDLGCVHTWVGVHVDDGSPRSGRAEARTCGARGYTAICHVLAPDLTAEACADLVTCAPAP